MAIVVDASVAFHWTVLTPYSPAANRLIASRQALVAPDLIAAELASAFLSASKADPGRRAKVVDGLQLFPRWFDEIVPSTSLRMEAFALAERFGHGVYDCIYLALAIERDALFVSLDEHFIRKVKRQPGFARSVVHLSDVNAT
jgi:predicted nucleic acid-binding protein